MYRFKFSKNVNNEMKLQQKTIEMMRKIPKGRVTTYKILAQSMGTKAYRTVGTCVKKNPYAPAVPCHRVVKSDGTIGQYSGRGGIKTKIKLLKKEGIVISNRKINLKKYLYKFK